MRYQLNQKILSWGNTYEIYNEAGEPVFRVVGKVFSWGNQLSFQDMAGTQLAFIRQRLWTLLPRYEVLIEGRKFAEIRQRWAWLKKRFTLDLAGADDYAITGSFLEYEYQFEQAGSKAAVVSKSFFTWGDTYGIDINDGENQLAILCAVVVIDLARQQRQRRAG